MQPSQVRHRSPWPALVGLALIVIAAAAALVWWRSGPIDPALVGRWQSTVESDRGLVQIDDMDISHSGEVAVERLVRGHGTFEAVDGHWRIGASDGTGASGRYAMTAPGTVVFRGFPFGGETWHREVMPEGGGALAGRWRGTFMDDSQGEAAFIIDADGRYRFAQTTRIQQMLTAREGRWRITDEDGGATTGRYQIADDGSLVVSGTSGPTIWRRR
jgi:hypothetical protein